MSKSAYDLVIRRQPIKCFSEYSCKWGNENIRYSDIINNVKLMDAEYKLSDCSNSFLYRKEHSLGFGQKQLLSSLPLLPDSLEVYSSVTITELDQDKSFHSIGFVRGNGDSQKRTFRFFEDNTGTIIPMITELFPNEQELTHQAITEKQSEYFGIDWRYLQESEKVVRGQGKCEAPLWELSKNNAFIAAVLVGCQICGRTSVSSQESKTTETIEPYNPTDEFVMKSRQLSHIRVYPLWYMDATLRHKPNKKIIKDWESALNYIDSSVDVLIPLKD